MLSQLVLTLPGKCLVVLGLPAQVVLLQGAQDLASSQLALSESLSHAESAKSKGRGIARCVGKAVKAWMSRT